MMMMMMCSIEYVTKICMFVAIIFTRGDRESYYIVKGMNARYEQYIYICKGEVRGAAATVEFIHSICKFCIRAILKIRLFMQKLFI